MDNDNEISRDEDTTDYEIKTEIEKMRSDFNLYCSVLFIIKI